MPNAFDIDETNERALVEKKEWRQQKKEKREKNIEDVYLNLTKLATTETNV